MGGGIRYVVKRLYPFAVVFLIWGLVARFETFPQYLIPPPEKVVRLFFEMLADGRLVKFAAISFKNAFIGFLLGSSLGIVLGAFCALRKGVYDFFVPLVSAAYPIPSIVWVPLSLLWFGFSERSLIFVVFLACFFNVFYNALAGIRNINPTYIRAAKNLNLNGWVYFREVVFFGSFPYLLTGLRLAVGQSWRVIVGGEMLASTVKGLGWFLWISSEFFRYDQVFVGIMTIGLIGLILENVVFKTIERKTVQQWY